MQAFMTCLYRSSRIVSVLLHEGVSVGNLGPVLGGPLGDRDHLAVILQGLRGFSFFNVASKATSASLALPLSSSMTP